MYPCTVYYSKHTVRLGIQWTSENGTAVDSNDSNEDDLLRNSLVVLVLELGTVFQGRSNGRYYSR